MDAAQPRELGLLEAGDHAEDFRLRAMLQLGLEAYHVPQRREGIVLAQLHHGVRFHGRVVRIGQAHRLHRAKAQRLAPALGHHFDGKAAFEIGRVLFPVLELSLRRRDQRVEEGIVLGLVHRAVDIGRRVAAGAGLVIAALAPGLRHVDGFEIDDRRNGIEEGQVAFARMRMDRFGQRLRGQRAGRDDHAVPVFRRYPGDFLAHDGHQRMGFQLCGNRLGKALAVDCQRAAGGHLMVRCGGDDQAARAAHFLVQHAHGIGRMVVRAEGIGADQLGQMVRLMGFGALYAPHFMQDHGHARVCGLPGGFGAGHAAADDMDRFDAHEGDMRSPAPRVKMVFAARRLAV